MIGHRWDHTYLLLYPVVLPPISAGIAAPVELCIAVPRGALVEAQEDNLIRVALRAARDVLDALVHRLAWENIAQDGKRTSAVHLSNFYVDTTLEAAREVVDVLHILGSEKARKASVAQRFLRPLRFFSVEYLLHADQDQVVWIRSEIPLYIRLRFRRLPHFEFQTSSRDLSREGLLRNVRQFICIVGDYFKLLVTFLQVEFFQSAPLFCPVDGLHGFEMILSSCHSGNDSMHRQH